LGLLLLVGATGVAVRASVGSPARQLSAIIAAGDLATDPVEPVLALLALLAEALCAYLLLLTALATAMSLPGAVGRSAAAGFRMLGMPSLRRGLEATLGGVLLANVALGTSPDIALAAIATAGSGQATLGRTAPARAAPTAALATATAPTVTASTATPSAPASPSVASSRVVVAGVGSAAFGAVLGVAVPVRTVSPPRLPPAAPGQDAPCGGNARGDHRSVADETAAHPAGTAGLGDPHQGRGPSSPSQGGDPSSPSTDTGLGRHRGSGRRAVRGSLAGRGGIHVVASGDTLWSIAKGHLPAARRTPSSIAGYWPVIYRANRHVIGSDPDRLLPGMRLAIPRRDAGRKGRRAPDPSPTSSRCGPSRPTELRNESQARDP
jgi:nucleoid-associated protein YgaU